MQLAPRSRILTSASLQHRPWISISMRHKIHSSRASDPACMHTVAEAASAAAEIDIATRGWRSMTGGQVSDMRCTMCGVDHETTHTRVSVSFSAPRTSFLRFDLADQSWPGFFRVWSVSRSQPHHIQGSSREQTLIAQANTGR